MSKKYKDFNKKIDEVEAEVEPLVEIKDELPLVKSTKCDFSLISRVKFRNYKRGDRIAPEDYENVLGCHEKNYVVKTLNTK